MLDVEVPPGVNPAVDQAADPADGRAARSGPARWAQERRPFLVAGSFVAAILLGVVLGLAWASDGQPAAAPSVSLEADDPVLTPPLPKVPWENSRSPGTPHRIAMSTQERTELRKPLGWLAAYEVRRNTNRSTPVASDVTIPDGLYYGAVEGADREQDVFWAVGMTQIAGVSDTDAPDPHVWKRVGGSPWELVGRGTAACTASIPPTLLTTWGGASSACRSA